MYNKHGYTNTRLYRTWKKIKERCLKENNINFKNYGGRGISICNEWLNPTVFINWALENGYNDNLQIDRINNDGNYCPENCRFVTIQENLGVGRKRNRKDNASGFCGVYKTTVNNNVYWVAKIKNERIGYFKTFEEARKSRIKKEIELYGKQMTF